MFIFNLFKRKQVEEIINKKNRLVRFIIFIISLFLVALTYNIFFVTNNLVVSGMSGLAIVVKSVINIKVSTFLIITTIILISLSFITLGKKETKTHMIGAMFFPTFVTLTEPIAKIINLELSSKLFIILIASVLFGTFMGIIYKVGYSTGGGDILNQIICKYAKVSIGTAGNYINLVIISLSSFIFGLSQTIYAIFSLIIINTLVDYICLGNSDSKLCIIKTKHSKYIEDFLLNEFDIGYSILESSGGTDKKRRKTIMCVVTSREYYKFKKMILDIDSSSFMVTHDCYEVMGGKSKRLLNFN